MQNLMKGDIVVNRWKNVLSKQLPGEHAQLEMAPEFRGSYDHPANPVPAAVLILMFPSGGRQWLVFIKRNVNGGPHSGQVSFPGGAMEKGDESLEHTALRETREELGISRTIRILGSLTPLHIPISNYQVTPFAGWLDGRPVFRPDRSEVQYVIEAAVIDLLDPANRLSETIKHHGRPIVAPYYRVGDEKIWGATAMILCEFLQLAARLQSHHC
jgi:8-oxo-dGTP pyrophosphatase MutT (NUDIX family)